MADFKSKFVPAFKYPLKWSVNDNTFDDAEKYPKKMGLGIPVDSMRDFIEHCEKLLADTENYSTAKIWNFEKGEEEIVPTVYLNGKGMQSPDGSSAYGNISPRKIEVEPNF
tara:strand:+ start:334 stop:666 length:333 start_codon:yes stop_codon:yes gene_type:complete